MPRTRRRQWGSITEVTRGKKYVLRWTQNTPEGRRRLTKTFYGTRAQANLELERIHLDREDDRPVPTVREAWERWALPALRKRMELGTLARGSMRLAERSWENYVGPRWGNVPVDQLKPLDLQEWLLTLPAAPADVALTTLRRIFSSVAMFVPLPLDPFSPSVRYLMPTRTTRAKSRRIYTLAEAREVAAAIRGTDFEPAFILSCFASCRPGEALGVRLEDVTEHPHGTMPLTAVRIVRQMGSGGDEPAPDGQLKTGKSVRTVVVLPEFGARLLEIAGERREFGTLWLCDRGDGLPMNRSRAARRWRELCDLHGLEHVPPSNLRTSWRTMCETELHLPWDLMEMLMGHKLPGISGSHYIDPSQEQIVESARAAFLGTSHNLG